MRTLPYARFTVLFLPGSAYTMVINARFNISDKLFRQFESLAVKDHKNDFHVMGQKKFSDFRKGDIQRLIPRKALNARDDQRKRNALRGELSRKFKGILVT